MKRFLAVFLATTTLLSTSVFADGGMRYVYNNDEVEVTAEAIFKDGIVYLPVASVCKALGYKVIEKDTNNSVTAEVKTKPGYFSVFLGKSKGRMNGMDIGLAKAPFKGKDVIYVTAGLIEDQLGVSVKYDSAKNTIYIDNKGEGKITSTVGQASAIKSATEKSGSSNSSGSSGSIVNGATYPGTNIPTFTSVTGVQPAESGSKSAKYNTDVYKVKAYREYLQQNGWKSVNGNSQMFTNGSHTVAWDYITMGSGFSSSYLSGNTSSTSKISLDCYLTISFS